MSSARGLPPSPPTPRRLVLAIACWVVTCLWTPLTWAQCDAVEVSVTVLDFGRIDVLDASTYDGAGRLVVRCHGGVSEGGVGYQISIDGGVSGDPAQRTMTGPEGDLQYGVFLDPAHAVPWGDDAVGEPLDDALGQGEDDRSYTIYGRILGHPQVPPGVYSDHLTMTLFF